jgi:hypothetical protein
MAEAESEALVHQVVDSLCAAITNAALEPA